jgi:hypothetical protein
MNASADLETQIAAVAKRIQEREPHLKEAQRQGDGWKAGNLGVAQAYDRGLLRDLCAQRSANTPAGGGRPSGQVFFGSSF